MIIYQKRFKKSQYVGGLLFDSNYQPLFTANVKLLDNQFFKFTDYTN
jgi:hypothetical protein